MGLSMWSRRLLVAVACVGLVTGVLPGFSTARVWTPDELMALPGHPRPQVAASVSVQPLMAAPPPARVRPAPAKPARAFAWPAASSATVVNGQAVVSGVTVGVEEAPEGTVVAVADQAQARTAGVNGVMFTLTPPNPAPTISPGAALGSGPPAAESPGAGKAPTVGASGVSVDIGSFGDGRGGGWLSRTSLVWLPGCSPTPRPGCAVDARPLGGGTVAGTSVVTGRLPVEAAAAGKPVVIAAVTGPSGTTGSFAQTPLSPSSEWSSGSGTGAFTWSYPITVPSAGAGPQPSLSIDYNSASVDGRVASTNNQTSWVGEGFDLSTGFIERRYVGCADDMGGGGNNSVKTGDLCWGPDAVTITLRGFTTDLVRTAPGASTWVGLRDTNTRAELLTDTSFGSNGDDTNEYWKVTTPDGTVYYFGTQKRGTGDTALSNATWTVPVFGNHPGEPGYASTFSASWKQQAWRWNLSYVVDTSGNTMSVFYAKETNSYLRNLTTKTAYDRGGYPTRIDYGQRRGTEWTSTPGYQVTFTTDVRCVPGATACNVETISTQTTQWPDVPGDQSCTGTSPCTGIYSPTFFSTQRLTKIATSALVGGALAPVTSWVLGQEWKDQQGPSAAVWLASITQTGTAAAGTGNPAITLPDVTFTGTSMDNRVDTVGDNAPALARWRITGISNGLGGSTAVSYLPAECTPNNKPTAPESNTKRCFPVQYTPPGATEPTIHYFHKYVTASVVSNPGSTGVATTTSYEYVGLPAWHFDDNMLVQATRRTYGDWRGYSQVITRVGGPGSSEALKYATVFFRGMDGDRLPGGGTRSVTVTDTGGNNPVTDYPRAAGMIREQVTYQLNSTYQLSGTLTTPWIGPTMATDPAGRAAGKIAVAVTTARTQLAAGGWRTTRTTTRFKDNTGQPDRVDDEGDLAVTGDERCTVTDYADSTAAWIYDTPSVQSTYRVSCAQTLSTTSLIGRTITYYDGAAAIGAAPTRGLATRVDVARYVIRGQQQPSYATTTSNYDALGRVKTTTDALGKTSKTDYTPAASVPATMVTLTNPKLHTVTTTFDPRIGPITITGANGDVVTGAYDTLGRVVSVWTAGLVRSRDAAAITYTYTLSNGSTPTAVTTATHTNSGAYANAVTFYDGQLRPIQTQTQTQLPGTEGMVEGRRLITQTSYDNRGLANRTIGPFVADGVVDTTLVGTPALNSPSAPVPVHTYTYDGAQRVVADRYTDGISSHAATTGTTYTGDTVAVTPPGVYPV